MSFVVILNLNWKLYIVPKFFQIKFRIMGSTLGIDNSQVAAAIFRTQLEFKNSMFHLTEDKQTLQPNTMQMSPINCNITAQALPLKQSSKQSV